MDPFVDELDLLELLEDGVEGADYLVREPSPDIFDPDKTSVLGSTTKADIREPSPDIFEGYMSDDEIDHTPCSATMKASIINKLNKMSRRKNDDNRSFLLRTILERLTANSTCTSRELYYNCPKNCAIGAFYQKVSIF